MSIYKINFVDVKHHIWSKDGNIVWTEGTLPDNVETTLMGCHNSIGSDDTDNSDTELESDVDNDEGDDDA